METKDLGIFDEVEKASSEVLLKKEIADLIFPEIGKSVLEILECFPERELKEGAMVTRIAPSPTGFMHIGSLYVALISERLAHQTDGVFYLRIEDTDKNREIRGAINVIIQSLKSFGINVDEGEIEKGEEKGDYGPYKQSERSDIYNVFIKDLLEKGDAYPCFTTHEELDKIKKLQDEMKVNPGYYGPWAKWRNKEDKEILTELEKGTPYVIRFRSKGSYTNNKVRFNDLIKGNIALPENSKDIVIMKQDGLPTYHFAHAIDDHLMGTTHVIRGDEWLPSTPLHIELFNSLGFDIPEYAHISPIQKLDGSSRKKLSKRSHPEASILHYEEAGYPREAIIEYLLNIIDSNFEEWRELNPELDNNDFQLDTNRLGGTGGALLDLNKLDNISKEVISRYSPEKIFDNLLEWALKNDTKLFEYMKTNNRYVLSILGIERGENTERVRKDLAKWSEFYQEILFFFDEELNVDLNNVSDLLSEIKNEYLITAINQLIEEYSDYDEKDIWFSKIKSICENNNFALNGKKYKKDPESFNGSIVHLTNFIRFSLSGKTQTKDLYQVMQIMGKDRVISRLNEGINLLR